MNTPNLEARRAQLVRSVELYFEACNEASRAKFEEALTPGCTHYFPPGMGSPYLHRDAIIELWAKCVRDFGSRWTIDRLVCDERADLVVIEWTHWKPKLIEHIRGSEWYTFDEEGRITSIWAHYASPRDPNRPANELEGFPYAAKQYPMLPPDAPDTPTRRAAEAGEPV